MTAPRQLNPSGVVLGLLHLTIGEDILLRILNDLTTVPDELSRGNFRLKKLIKLLQTTTLRLWNAEVEVDDTES